MPSLIQYQVDAFSSELFGGNPAAVIKLEAFLSDELMQNIAMENNLSETAFVVPGTTPHYYDLRWFTPTHEIDFCGHATIATAHVLAAELGEAAPFRFHTQVGELIVTESGGMYHIDAPISPARPVEITSEMRAAFPHPIDSAFMAAANLVLVFENADDVAACIPDMQSILPLSDDGVAITASGDGEYDCVSRYFAPVMGIDEDPVTGSLHAGVGPYWATRLGKTKLTARQASKRGGTLYLDVGESRIVISGAAVTFMKAEIRLP